MNQGGGGTWIPHIGLERGSLLEARIFFVTCFENSYLVDFSPLKSLVVRNFRCRVNL
jgi:hypothetical protein